VSASSLETGTPLARDAGPSGVSLFLETPTTRGPWRIRLTNEGDVPVNVVADVRFLRLDVTPRGAAKSRRCELPVTMRPSDELQRAVVIPPGGAFVESFEPLLYCFDSRERGLLASGSTVVARLGWPDDRRGPWAVWPVDAADGGGAREHAIASPPVGLPDEPVPPPTRPTTLSAGEDAAPRLSLVTPVAIDAASLEDLVIPITLRNEASAPVTVRFRPDVIGFDVTSQGAFEHCVWPAPPGAPTREVFTTLPPSGTTEITVTLPSYCGGRILDRSGLLWVRPWLDTRAASGASVGVRTFDGVVIASKGTMVRLQKGRLPTPLSVPRIQK
jgi:hypothetical protein